MVQHCAVVFASPFIELRLKTMTRRVYAAHQVSGTNAEEHTVLPHRFRGQFANIRNKSKIDVIGRCEAASLL